MHDRERDCVEGAVQLDGLQLLQVPTTRVVQFVVLTEPDRDPWSQVPTADPQRGMLGAQAGAFVTVVG